MRWLQIAMIGVLTAGAPALAQNDCDRSYPDVCIPPPPPDLDCSDVPHRGFRVIGDDPHRFDRDRDGIACEG
jgi:micrococcal nuclease